MTDNIIEKIRAEIKRRYKECKGATPATEYQELLDFIDSMQKEPKECMYSKDDYTDEDRKVLCDGCEEECEFAQKKYPTSVWHDASEKAINNAPILFHSTYDNRWYALSHNGINWNVVDKWAYIDDLLKL